MTDTSTKYIKVAAKGHARSMVEVYRMLEEEVGSSLLNDIISYVSKTD